MKSLQQMMANIEARIRSKDEVKNSSNNIEEGRDLCENSVTKSNSLARGYYRFNLVEKRVMEALISKLNPQISDKFSLQKLELKAIEYAKAFNVSEKLAYRDIESAISGLMGRVFSVPITDGREEFTLMSNAQYLEGDGKITCSFNSYITPHLIGLIKKFTKYPLQIASNFKSSYTWRMYEILVSWAKDPKVTEGILAGWFTIEVTELRQMLGVPESYPWGMFDKQIIQTAKKELLEKANIEVEIERTKSSRKITHLKFIFAETKN
jgi:plasmid replication initiation protein